MKWANNFHLQESSEAVRLVVQRMRVTIVHSTESSKPEKDREFKPHPNIITRNPLLWIG